MHRSTWVALTVMCLVALSVSGAGADECAATQADQNSACGKFKDKKACETPSVSTAQKAAVGTNAKCCQWVRKGKFDTGFTTVCSANEVTFAKMLPGDFPAGNPKDGCPEARGKLQDACAIASTDLDACLSLYTTSDVQLARFNAAHPEKEPLAGNLACCEVKPGNAKAPKTSPLAKASCVPNASTQELISKTLLFETPVPAGEAALPSGDDEASAAEAKKREDEILAKMEEDKKRKEEERRRVEVEQQEQRRLEEEKEAQARLVVEAARQEDLRRAEEEAKARGEGLAAPAAVPGADGSENPQDAGIVAGNTEREEPAPAAREELEPVAVGPAAAAALAPAAAAPIRHLRVPTVIKSFETADVDSALYVKLYKRENGQTVVEVAQGPK